MKTEEITNSQDIIDSRDIIARIEHLRGELNDLREAATEAEPDDKEATMEALADWLGVEASILPDDLSELDDLSKWNSGSDEASELYSLEQLAEEAEGCGDWEHGEGLIRDSYFQEYAEQLADDIGAIEKSTAWPCCHIDWEAAADALKQDYSSVTFNGVEYWIRS